MPSIPQVGAFEVHVYKPEMVVEVVVVVEVEVVVVSVVVFASRFTWHSLMLPARRE